MDIRHTRNECIAVFCIWVNLQVQLEIVFKVYTKIIDLKTEIDRNSDPLLFVLTILTSVTQGEDISIPSACNP